MKRKRSLLEQEAEKSREAQEGSATDDDAAKVKRPNGFDMFSDDVNMFAEAHSVSNR